MRRMNENAVTHRTLHGTNNNSNSFSGLHCTRKQNNMEKRIKIVRVLKPFVMIIGSWSIILTCILVYRKYIIEFAMFANKRMTYHRKVRTLICQWTIRHGLSLLCT